MGLLGTQTNPPMIALPTPDRAFALFLQRVALDAAGLAAGHFVCRGLGLGSRAVYAVMGGLASAVGYSLALRHGLMLLPPYEGAMITAGIIPVLTGMMSGFLYGQFAGRERIQSDASPAAQVSAKPQPAVALPVPPTSFDGPVQVRTSAAAMFLASCVPSLLISTLFFTLSYSFLSGIQDSPGEPMKFDWSRQILAFAAPAQMFLMTSMVTMIPSAIFVALAHAVARALRRTDGLSYAGLGALVGLAFGVALIPFGGWPSFPFTGVGFLILPLAVFGAIMMAVYRRFAGLEPRALPEAVLATDVETLVPEDHPARRAHAVILNG